MNKKKLLASAIAVLFTLSAAQATDITGVTGVNGVFDINAEKVNGDVGYRHYDNFNLSQGDIANLIYQKGDRNLETFVNMVDNRININGIVNTMRDGNFYNGHAVFISPNGMVVGASGVLNVGSLSVMAPSMDKYNSLKGEYGDNNFVNINNLSTLKKESRDGNIDIAGKVFARNGITIDGKRVNIPGSVINGVGSNEALSDNAAADLLFNSLVNTNGLPKADAVTAQNGSLLLVRSGNADDASINVDGHIVNFSSGETALTNHGKAGMIVSGTVAANDRLTLHNTNGTQNVNGVITNKNGKLIISNKSNEDLNIGKKADLSTDNEMQIVNYQGDGHLAFAGTAVADQKIDIVNNGKGGLTVTSNGQTLTNNLRVANRGGELVTSAGSTLEGLESVTVESVGARINGDVKSDANVKITNTASNLKVGGNVSVTDGTVRIYNTGDKLELAAGSTVSGKGNVAIKNLGKDGMSLEGSIVNDGETAINNSDGELVVNGSIDAKGNMSIINRDNGSRLFITKNANIDHKGQMLKIVNTGDDGMIVNGNIKNEGKLYIYNDNGQMHIGANADPSVITRIENHDGTLYINSRKDSSGVNITTQAMISNQGGGSTVIKHNGEGLAERGVNLQGTIVADGETAINNYNNDMYVSGTIYSSGDLGIINRADGGEMTLASDGMIYAESNANIKHYGDGDVTVNSTIYHNGRLDVIGNNGQLTMGGEINNVGEDMTYVTSRSNGTGINVTSGFVVNSNGDVLIKNISGEDGLRFAGTINNAGGQTALVNKEGSMTVAGSIDNTGSEHSVIISNFGDQLVAKGLIKNDGEVRIVDHAPDTDLKNLTVEADTYKFYGAKTKTEPQAE